MLHGRGVCRVAPPPQVAAAVTCAGDLISQLILESRDTVDCRRLLACTLLGGVLDGSMMQRWFALVHRRLPGHSSFMQRLVIHELICAPMSAFAFILGTTASSGKHLDPWRKAQQELAPAVGCHWLLVAPTMTFNASSVPKPYQLLVANSASLMWAAVLSRLSHRPMRPQRPAAANAVNERLHDNKAEAHTARAISAWPIRGDR